MKITIANTFAHNIEKLSVVSMVSVCPLLSCKHVVELTQYTIFKNVSDRLLMPVLFCILWVKTGPRNFDCVTYLTLSLGSVKTWWELSLYGSDAWPGADKI